MVRAFEICATEEDKTRVEQYLKVEINEMFRDNRVWKIDWTKEPLPLLVNCVYVTIMCLSCD